MQKKPDRTRTRSSQLCACKTAPPPITLPQITLPNSSLFANRGTPPAPARLNSPC